MEHATYIFEEIDLSEGYSFDTEASVALPSLEKSIRKICCLGAGYVVLTSRPKQNLN